MSPLSLRAIARRCFARIRYALADAVEELQDLIDESRDRGDP